MVQSFGVAVVWWGAEMIGLLCWLLLKAFGQACYVLERPRKMMRLIQAAADSSAPTTDARARAKPWWSFCAKLLAEMKITPL